MKPAKIFKISFIIIASILLILLIGTGLFIYFFPKDRVRSLVIEQAETVLQRKVTLESIYYSPRGIILRNLTIHEDKPVESPVMVSAEWVNLGLALRPLLNKEIDVKHLFFYKLNANITFDEKGVSNLEKMINTVLKTPDSSLKTKISSVKLTNATINIIKPVDVLNPLEGSYSIDATVKFPAPNLLQITNCTIILPEKRGKVKPEISIATDSFKLTGEVELDKVSLAWVYKWHGTSYPQPYDIVTGKVRELYITTDKIEGFVKATSTLHKSSKIVHADGFCRVEPPKRTVLITGTQARIDSSSVYLNRLAFTMDGDLLGFDASNANASVTDLRELVPVIPSSLYGWVTGNLAYNNGKVSCAMHLKEAGYDYSSKMISGMNTDIAIDKNVFKLEKIPMKVFGHDCIVSAASTDGDFKRLILNLSGEKLNLTRIQTGSGGREKSVDSPMEIAGNISTGRLETPDFNLDNLNVNYQVKGKSIAINQFSCKFAGSDLKGRGAIDLSTVPPKASGVINFANLRIQSLGIVSEKFKNRFFGNASGNLNLSMDLASQMFDTLRGTVDFSIDNGKVVDTGIQNGLGIWLSELRYKLKDLEFNKIYGNAQIVGKLFQINSFIFKSENIRLRMEGPLSRDMNTAGLNLSLEFSDYFLQDIPRPAVMGLKKYQTGQWYIIPFNVKGDITESKNIHQVK